jgi:hypothetical protein
MSFILTTHSYTEHSQHKWHVKKVGKTVKKSSETDDYWQLVDEDLREIRESARENTTDANAIAKHVGK